MKQDFRSSNEAKIKIDVKQCLSWRFQTGDLRNRATNKPIMSCFDVTIIIICLLMIIVQ